MFALTAAAHQHFVFLLLLTRLLHLQYEREAALKDFSAGTVRVLIATDVASRGLDVKDVGHVINMDLPRAFEDYVHRIGECVRLLLWDCVSGRASSSLLVLQRTWCNCSQQEELLSLASHVTVDPAQLCTMISPDSHRHASCWSLRCPCIASNVCLFAVLHLPDQLHNVVTAGRTGRAGTRGRATSFFTDRDAFLVSQIKTALAELEKGNVAAFAMGKEARKAEKELAQKFKSNMKLSSEGLVGTGSGLAPAVKVDGKYAYMAAATAATSASAGAADAAWVSCAAAVHDGWRWQQEGSGGLPA
jgi:hypothetical protein